MRLCPWLFFACLLLGACAGPQAGLLQKVREIHPDGKISAPLAEKDLSPFQLLLRQSFPSPKARFALLGKSPPAPASVQAVWALEIDRPDGDGSAGGYLALVHDARSVELRYYEQSDHRPRIDRYYHRLLNDDEVAAWEALQQAHPLAQLRQFHPEAPASHAVVPVADGTADADTAVLDDGLTYRITDARSDATLTATFSAPLSPPLAQLIDHLRHLRDAGGFACTYVRSIPLTAHSMYADPEHKVLWVWNRGEDLRIAVGADADSSALQWLAYQSGRWQPSVEPGSEPAPATDGATAPASEPAPAAEVSAQDAAPTSDPATQPTAAAPDARVPLENPGLLPTAERWWTQPQQDATVVMHYVPQSAMYGVTHGFVVPGFRFDDAHCALNAERGLLYLIHDGQLFSLEIPAGAR